MQRSGSDTIKYHHLTQNTVRESDKKHKETSHSRRARRPAFSHQVTTRLQETDMAVWKRQRQSTKKTSIKESSPWNHHYENY